MQGFIDSGVVFKPGEIPMFYRRVGFDKKCIPNITALEEQYTYLFIEGRHATRDDEHKIFETAAMHIWHDAGEKYLTRREVNSYVNYIRDRAQEAGLKDWRFVEKALMHIEQTAHQFVLNVHGDLTFENIIITPDDQIVFIDPGLPRGMYTPALDFGKILQSSVMRWEERKWDEPNPIPEWATTTDLAFLVTHWIRLIRHWPTLPVKKGLDALEFLLDERLS